MSEMQFSCAIGALDVRSISVVERLHELTVADVVVVSQDPSLDLEATLMEDARFRLAAGQAKFMMGERSWKGIVASAQQLRSLEPGRDGSMPLSQYAFRIVPKLWLLQHRTNYRIFQRLAIPDIIDALLDDWQLQAQWQIDRAAYPKLEFKVQYDESDFHFFRRLLEEAGITLVSTSSAADGILLADKPTVTPFCERADISYNTGAEHRFERDCAIRLELRHDVRPGAVHRRDHDFRSPAEPLVASARPGVSERQLEHTHYQPAGMLREGAGGSTPVADNRGAYRREVSHGNLRAKRSIESLRTRKRYVAFETNVLDIEPGVGFSIVDHPHDTLSQPLTVNAITIEAEAVGDWSIVTEASFQADVFRPPMMTKKPRIFGVQSATVVGRDEDEIHVDEYGRIKVLFPWDRAGIRDDDASCWLRVSQGWSGGYYGMVNLPRVGQEVLVSFLDGDPDAPIVTGRVHNEHQPTPYKLPQDKTISGWKTCSSPANGGYNEIKFEDKADHELFYMRAQRDFHRLVQRDQSERIQRHHFQTVEQDRHVVVKQNQRERIEKNCHLVIEGSRFQQIEGSTSLRVNAKSITEAGDELIVSAPRIVINAGDTMTIQGPAGFITLHSGGIDLVGDHINLNSGGSPLQASQTAEEPQIAEEAQPKDHHSLIED